MKNKEIFKSSAVSTLNGICQEYNEMVKKSITTMWVSDDMNIVVSKPLYTNEDLSKKADEFFKEYERLVKELEDD